MSSNRITARNLTKAHKLRSGGQWVAITRIIHRPAKWVFSKGEAKLIEGRILVLLADGTETDFAPEKKVKFKEFNYQPGQAADPRHDPRNRHHLTDVNREDAHFGDIHRSK